MKKLLAKLFGKNKKKETPAPQKKEVQVPNKVTISAEQLCQIDPTKMSSDTIRNHLALLYKRHNSAVSSMKPELRREARQMLEAIAECRQRYVDEVTEK